MDKNVPKNIASILRRSRKESGKSQEDLAAALNVSRKTVQNWESGETTPTFRRCVEWMEALGVPALPFYLEMLNPQAFTVSPADDDEKIRNALLSLVSSYSPDIQRKLLFMLHCKHGSDLEGIIEMWSAYFHLPLSLRLVVAQTIMTDYMVAEAEDTLVGMDYIHPDLDVLRESVLSAREAVLLRNKSYKLKK